jgi:hypothetical protein
VPAFNDAASRIASSQCSRITSTLTRCPAGQAASGFDRIYAARKDGDAVPAFLAVPDHAKAGISNWAFRELLLRRLQLLQANDVGRSFVEPAKKNGKPAIDAV